MSAADNANFSSILLKKMNISYFCATKLKIATFGGKQPKRFEQDKAEINVTSYIKAETSCQSNNTRNSLIQWQTSDKNVC